MCTLIALHRCVPGQPLLVAANRDEYLDRPAALPELQRSGDRWLVAPRDLRAGGTWLGVNDAGLFVGITNRPVPSPDAERRSRGLLVLDALATSSAAQAARALEHLPANAYNPFNLLVADARDAFAIVYEDKPAVSELGPGAHVVGNAEPDDDRHPKTARLLAESRFVADTPGRDPLGSLAEICRDHDVTAGPLGAACVHTDGYGTRSATLLRLADDFESNALLHAEGPPCSTRFTDRTPLLRELGSHPVAGAEDRLRRMC